MSTGDGIDSGIETEIERALAAFRSGGPVLVYDFNDREGETDIIYPAETVSPEAIAQLRNDAGGLICVALSDAVSREFSLPFRENILDHPIATGHDLSYDDRSSFSLTVNHRDTFTGVTDEDRTRTITKLAAAARAVTEDNDYNVDDFAAEFRAPGHVHLLRAAPNLLVNRQGHTELGLALARASDITPAVVVCEMLDDENGKALSVTDTRNYAERGGYPFLEGEWIVEAFG